MAKRTTFEHVKYEHPQGLQYDADTLYIFEEDGQEYCAFRCPQCGHIIILTVNGSKGCQWSKQVNGDGTITLSPSIFIGCCNAHFFIRNNKIEWC